MTESLAADFLWDTRRVGQRVHRMREIVWHEFPVDLAAAKTSAKLRRRALFGFTGIAGFMLGKTQTEPVRCPRGLVTATECRDGDIADGQETQRVGRLEIIDSEMTFDQQGLALNEDRSLLEVDVRLR